MATLALQKSDDQKLPMVCMRCGAAATVRVEHTFYWTPTSVYFAAWLRLAGWVVITSARTKSTTIHVPMCAEHQRHWFWLATLQYVGLLVFLLLCAMAVVLAFQQPDSVEVMRRQALNEPPVHGFWSFLLVWLLCPMPTVWLIAVGVYYWRSIRATAITDDGVTLTNVAESFVEEMNRMPSFRRGPGG